MSLNSRPGMLSFVGIPCVDRTRRGPGMKRGADFLRKWITSPCFCMNFIAHVPQTDGWFRAGSQ